jgi:hypothetical protein
MINRYNQTSNLCEFGTEFWGWVGAKLGFWVDVWGAELILSQVRIHVGPLLFKSMKFVAEIVNTWVEEL